MTLLLVFFACVYSFNVSYPYSYSNKNGPFELKWGFSQTNGAPEINMQFSLPSDVYIGLGLGCDSSAKCDVILGTADGVSDEWEENGDVASVPDVKLGGKNDLRNTKVETSDYGLMTVSFTRDLDTGDKYDYVLSPTKTNMVYAFCALPWCDDVTAAHGPNDWEIISVDLSGRSNSVKDVQCKAGSPALCSCSELIKLGAIKSFDECTQEAAIAYCKEHGACPAIENFNIMHDGRIERSVL